METGTRSVNCMYTIIHMIISEIMHPTVRWNGFEIVSWLFSNRTSCQTDIQVMMNSSGWSFPSFFQCWQANRFLSREENGRCVLARTYALTMMSVCVVVTDRQWAYCGSDMWEMSIRQVLCCGGLQGRDWSVHPPALAEAGYSCLKRAEQSHKDLKWNLSIHSSMGVFNALQESIVVSGRDKSERGFNICN